jgi:hypothetical protein
VAKPAAAPEPEDVVFSRGPARRPQPRVADPLLQWASGLQTKERTIYAGWLVEPTIAWSVSESTAIAASEDAPPAWDGACYAPDLL